MYTLKIALFESMRIAKIAFSEDMRLAEIANDS